MCGYGILQQLEKRKSKSRRYRTAAVKAGRTLKVYEASKRFKAAVLLPRGHRQKTVDKILTKLTFLRQIVDEFVDEASLNISPLSNTGQFYSVGVKKLS